MSNTAPAKQVRKPKKLPFVIMCILSAIVAVLNVLLCVLVPKYYTTINSFLYKGPDADEVAAFLSGFCGYDAEGRKRRYCHAGK